MKLNDLFEGPPYDLGNLTHPIWKDEDLISDNALARDYIFLGTLERAGKEFNYHLLKTKRSALVTHKKENAEKNNIVVTLLFQKAPGLPVKNELQVDTVMADPAFQSRDLTSALYIVLARYGYAVISDFTQYTGGKKLWQKLAKESEIRKFVVRIWDDEAQDWVKDENGVPVVYNAANITDDKIWQAVSTDEGTRLLVLQNK